MRSASLVLLLASAVVAQPLRDVTPADVAPGPRDHTRLWWANGLRGERVRWVETGWYGFALNTDTLAVPHFGQLNAAGDYGGSTGEPNPGLAALPAGRLELTIVSNNRLYRAVAGGAPSQHAGPRMVETGRFLARADLTDLVFRDEAGAKLPVEARLETIAWPDRLAVGFEARPAPATIAAGSGFGRVAGGWGFDGTNSVELPAASEADQLSWECWVYVPPGPQPTKAYPWLLCAAGHEWADGHFGISLQNAQPRAYLNLGGGRDNCHQVGPEGHGSALSVDAWHHLAATYDGRDLRLYVDGKPRGALSVNKPRPVANVPLMLGMRGDRSGDGYHFAGALDEVRVWRRALSAEEVAAHAAAPDKVAEDATISRSSCFDANGNAAAKRPDEAAVISTMRLRLATAAQTFETINPPDADRVYLRLRVTPTGFVQDNAPAPTVKAPGDAEQDGWRGWQVVDLNRAERTGADNDVLDTLPFSVENPTNEPAVARLLLRRDQGPTSITGVSPMLLDVAGQPTGLPVQLSKNWHTADGRQLLYQGMWLHAATMLRLPPRSRISLKAAVAYAHYGGVAAASHAQLCLIGWGSNQQWDQAALGSWGESICFEPDQAQAQCLVTDVRPLMVYAMHDGKTKWSWTGNLGGGDVLRLFDSAGQRVPPRAMRTTYQRQGPCLTEVTYAGRTGGMAHQTTAQLWRGDDITRCLYHITLRAEERIPFSRLVLFQIGADTYSYTSERRMACGNAAGLTREWATQWGGNVDQTAPLELLGASPWVSLHEAVPREKCGREGWGNRGIVVRSWDAVLGGKPARPWLVERGQGQGNSSSADLLPPPDVKELLPGDRLDAVIEHVIIPQSATGYYGPNAALRAALAKDADTWRMVQREAVDNATEPTVAVGRLLRRRPLLVRADGGRAEFGLRGGLGYVPVTLTGLARAGGVLEELVDGAWRPVTQPWQVDQDASDRSWQLTTTLPADDRADRRYRFTISPRTTP
ncbi:MAG: LamG domain-containing protein [Armatimonadetes bacterium]|nr:LamG domain-containing protein [Armatimonadota bacterium]